MDLVKCSSPYFSGFSVQGMVWVNPLLRFTKTTDFLLKRPVLRAGVPEWLLNLGGHFRPKKKKSSPPIRRRHPPAPWPLPPPRETPPPSWDFQKKNRSPTTPAPRTPPCPSPSKKILKLFEYSLGNHGRFLHSFAPFTRIHSLHSRE